MKHCLFVSAIVCLFLAVSARGAAFHLRYEKAATARESFAASMRASLAAGAAPAAEGNARTWPQLAESVLRRIARDFGPEATLPLLIEHDWALQDGFYGNAGYHTAAILKAIAQAGPAASSLRTRYDALTKEKATPEDARWAALYREACTLRRELRLAPSREAIRRIVFTKHADLGGSHYAYTEGLSDANAERQFHPGAALCVLEMEETAGRMRTLIDDRMGVIRDPDVSFDGRRILFAWKKSDRQDDYHLYEMDGPGGAVRQITHGLGFADYEGQYLPDGEIIFASTRCVQAVDCWWTEVSNLYRIAPDGRYLRRLGFDQVHTNYPTVMADGRIIYTRWEYNDRGQIYPQPLFQMNPDGTGQTEFYGNNSWFPTTIMHARGIPGSDRVLCVLSGHHSRQKGWLAVVDPSLGRQENSGVQLVAPIRETRADRIDSYGQSGDQFQYPYPLDDQRCIVTFKPDGTTLPFAIYHMDLDGHRELLAADVTISCNQPVPLRARPTPPVRRGTADYAKDTGTVYLQDVYEGPGLAGIPRGTVKALRVVALEYRALAVTSNGNRGPAGGALISTPISIQGAWDVKVVLGTVKVHEDGSAAFTVPARTPLYVQALDEKGHAVQSMRSWMTLQGGEVASCVGCHESKNSAPPVMRHTLAAKAGVQSITPWQGAPRGFSFHKEVQPILDRHCISCHDLPEGQKPDKPDRAFSLKGEPGTFSTAYKALANPKYTSWISPQSVPSMLPPYDAGAARSPLVKLLEKGHYGARLSGEEMERLACWIDLAVPCFGDYREGLKGEDLARYNRLLEKRRKSEEIVQRGVVEFIRDGQGQ